MQVDFYQLTRDPAEKILVSLAQKAVGDEARLLIVSSDEKQLADISAALWAVKGDAFLANAVSEGSEGDKAQPILLSATCDATNEAKFIALADGEWRDEALQFDRAFYLFAPERTDDARAAWRKLGESEDIARKYWRQDGGRWVEGP